VARARGHDRDGLAGVHAWVSKGGAGGSHWRHHASQLAPLNLAIAVEQTEKQDSAHVQPVIRMDA
jgi:hypothetical protein